MRKLILVVAVIVSVFIMVLLPNRAQSKNERWHLGKWEPGYHNVVNAIYYEFCGHGYRYCQLGNEAYRVAGCESTYNRRATNGQYLGLFQMGSNERARFGYGKSPWAQARGAHNYYNYRDSGGQQKWKPWDCKP